MTYPVVVPACDGKPLLLTADLVREIIHLFTELAEYHGTAVEALDSKEESLAAHAAKAQVVEFTQSAALVHDVLYVLANFKGEYFKVVEGLSDTEEALRGGTTRAGE